MTAEPQESTPDTTQPADWPAAHRADLLAALNDAPSQWHRKAWQVVKQVNYAAEHPVCAHRWGWVAELCARRRMNRHADDIGVFYTARSYAERWEKRIAEPERLELEQ